MGGGAAMRSAAKIPAYAAFRSLPSPLPLGEPATFGFQSARPSLGFASVSLTDARERSSPTICPSSLHGGIDAASVQRPSWQPDDWDFVAHEESEFDSISPQPRVVFGPAPTLEEAREATCDLKEALDKIYFSSGGGTGIDIIQASTLAHENLEDPITKTCVTTQSPAIISSLPKNVINAFSLLKESSDAQNVVASLASDKNVWEAVMKNEKVMEYLLHATSIHPEDNTENSHTRSGDKDTENGLTGLMKSMKLKVVEMVSNLSEFMQGMFGKSEEANSADRTSSWDFMDKTMCAFIGMAILTMLMVLLKRK